MRSIETEGVCRLDALRNPRGVAADGGFGVLHEFRQREEAAVHLEGRAGTGTAVISGRLGDEDAVGVVEGLAGEQQRCALGEHLVALPLGTAEAIPVIAPIGFEAGGVADAFHPGDELKERGQPGDEHGDRREPDRAGRVCAVFEGLCFERHAGIIRQDAQVWDADIRNPLV